MSSSATVYAGTPPAGQESNPNAPFEATGLIVVIAIFVPLATILTCLRTYTRAVLAHGYGLDDGKVKSCIPFQPLIMLQLSCALQR